MPNTKYGITINGKEHQVLIAPQGSDNYNVTVDGSVYPVTVRTLELDDITSHIIGLASTYYEYTGEEIRPEVRTDDTVTLGTDFNVIYSNNVEVGTGTTTIIGIGNYSGTLSLDFTIAGTEPEEDMDFDEETVPDTMENQAPTDDTVEENVPEAVEEPVSEDDNETIEESKKEEEVIVESDDEENVTAKEFAEENVTEEVEKETDEESKEDVSEDEVEHV